MERRKAVIAAATASLTLLAGAAAVSLNTGIVGASGNDGAGEISPVVDTAPTTPSTIYVDEPPADGTTAAGSTAQAPSAGASGDRDDDRYEADDEDEDESEDGRSQAADRDDEEHEYEGADDDD
jgi:hypothetical protein